MELTIDKTVYDTMLQAARQALPLEACGLCGGRDGRVTQGRVLTNADASAEHYALLPDEQFAAIRGFRADGLRLLAIWHSHPATPARLSAEDLRLAYTPDVVYLVLSLADARAPDLRGYTVSGGEASTVAISLSNSNLEGQP